MVTARDAAGRRQRMTADSLGRVWKSEVLNTDGTVYSATTTLYDALDRVLRTRAYQGAAPSPEPSGEGSAYQTALMTYDGHGRLQTSKAADQTAAAQYTYFDDDAAKSVTDARGSVTPYAYNDSCHLVTGVSYSAPASAQTDKGGTTPISPAPSVTYEYDAAGNRKSMATAGGAGGGCTYAYDALSRMTSEARTLPGLSGDFTLAYEYTAGGLLRKVTDQRSGTSFTTEFNAVGEETGVSAIGYGGATTQFASQMQYRASGALKSAAYGNGTSLGLSYDGQGRIGGYTLAGLGWPGVVDPPLPRFSVGANYLYHDDGRLKFAGQLGGASVQDRAYSYDHVGRLKAAYSGAEARDFRDGTTGGAADGPFKETFSYDALGDLLETGGRFWSRADATSSTYDGRGRNTAWEYDAEGDLVSGTGARYGYDAAGRQAVVGQERGQFRDAAGEQYVNYVFTNTAAYDGDGGMVRYEKRIDSTLNGTPSPPFVDVTYYVRSTVLGGAAVFDLTLPTNSEPTPLRITPQIPSPPTLNYSPY